MERGVQLRIDSHCSDPAKPKDAIFEKWQIGVINSSSVHSSIRSDEYQIMKSSYTAVD